MDFFQAFPAFRALSHPAIAGLSLRLIVLAALPYDQEGYYFPLSEPRYWLQRPEGKAIGVGGLQVRPDARPPFQTLSRHLRREWRVRADLPPASHLYLLWPEDEALIPIAELGDRWGVPHILLLTPPHLGGEPLPDALVQAVYFLRLRRRPRSERPLLFVAHGALLRFLDRMEPWPVSTLQAAPWAHFEAGAAIPSDGRLRPVLALRALRRLYHAGLFPLDSE